LDPTIFLTGAAMARAGIDSVWVRLEDGAPRLARSGWPNQTIRQAYPDEHGPGSGDWMIALEVGELSAGDHEVHVLAVSMSGSSTVAIRTLAVDMPEAYRRWLASAPKARRRSSAAGGVAVLVMGSPRRDQASGGDGLWRPSSPAGLRSILGQTHRHWRLGLVGSACEALASADEWRALPNERKLGDGEFECLEDTLKALAADGVEHVVFAGVGDLLGREALMTLTSQGAADLVYGDSDQLRPDGERERPFFRPAFSPELLLAWDYIGPVFLLRAERLRQASRIEGRALSGTYDVLLRLLDMDLDVVNVHEVLYALATNRSSPELELQAELELQVVSALAGRRGFQVEVKHRPGGRRSLRWEPRSEPLVSIVIPSAGAPELLGPCLRSLDAGTTYEKLEVVLVDTTAGTVEIDTSALGGKPCRTIPCALPFNYSVVNNLGTRCSRGEVLLYLNDDTIVDTPDWIERMLGQLQQPGVGIVGAELTYPEGLIQHGGVCFALGGPSHAGVLLDQDDGGYFGMLQTQRNCAAVTGACLMTTRAHYEEAEGFDERLAIEYGDVDFCLKIGCLGLRTVMLPDVRLTHMESITRGAVAQHADRRFFQSRWPAQRYGNERFFPRTPMRT
jgi:hypothetical protein